MKEKDPNSLMSPWELHIFKYFWENLEPRDKAQIEEQLRQLDAERPDQYNLTKVKERVAKAKKG